MASRQPDPQQVAAALAAYQEQSVELRAKLSEYIQRLWQSLGSWRNADIPRFLEQALPAVLGAQRTMATLTAAYLAQQQQLALGGLFTPASIDPARVTGAAARNGTSPRDVYTRPFQLVWRQLDELPRASGSIDKAIEAGMNRAVQSAVTDVQLAKVQTSRRILTTNRNVVGYRRQLEGPHSCALCIVASTQRYHRSTLLPIHPACDCSVAQIFGGEKVDLTIDPQLLADAHDRIQETFGRSSPGARIVPGARTTNGDLIRYRDVLISHEHGELGPVLAVKGRPFVGPLDIAS